VPAAQRRALVLTAIGGWTAKEVSRREGIPLGTAKTRIRSGLLALRELLQADHQREPQ
jgi:DNA-directed RNA polymerase specialized sigma24 family protein